LSEVYKHLSWAQRLFQEEDTSSAVFLPAALLKSSFKQNLFLEGFIRSAAEGVVGTPEDYLSSAFPDGLDEEDIKDTLAKLGITVIDLPELEVYEIGDRGQIADLGAIIKEERIRKNSYRGFSQIEAESEILFIIRSLRGGKYRSPIIAKIDRTFFLSQSLVLDRVAEKNRVSRGLPKPCIAI
jgi:hypothetical protein